VDSELILNPSDYLWIGVHNSIAGNANQMQKGIFMLGIVTCPDIKWTGNWATYVPPLVAGCPSNEYYGDAVDFNGDGSLFVDLWVLTLTDARPDTFNGIGVLDAKELHCEGPSWDNVVMLWDGSTGDLLDTIIIHQVPEPATIALLGLGGLFLRRRKK
jgi:hypothetical protein